ncbi:copper chaperone for superoxide dismutase-like isoform X2 [Dreissena polymorpha]|uniref:Superoxide dismutase copper chaperone n=1 Tax=Dreissena polymorpha TaxID=45954 RepID=A0A9D4L5W2_DREPO|nr:copper chaperone for superoxide dismutase-like isoform X2 [Dreissena polymorpha]KAH3852383.1 hypothetical protein DPMN_094889 [Dreissena polymorpha]
MAAPTKLEFDVDMTCGNCVKKIENAFKGIEGVKSLDVNLLRGQVIVECNLGTEKVKSVIESTGKKAVLKGMGGSKGAAVSIMDVGSEAIRGLIRLVQTDERQLVIDGTLDGLTPGVHGLCVHECGDISEGCNSCGDIYGRDVSGQVSMGELGDIKAGPDGRAEFRIVSDRLKVWEMIGRSLIIHNGSIDEIKRNNSRDQRLTCGIIARSAGLFQNSKKICACDGVTQWEERNVPAAGHSRQAHL